MATGRTKYKDGAITQETYKLDKNILYKLRDWEEESEKRDLFKNEVLGGKYYSVEIDGLNIKVESDALKEYPGKLFVYLQKSEQTGRHLTPLMEEFANCECKLQLQQQLPQVSIEMILLVFKPGIGLLKSGG